MFGEKYNYDDEICQSLHQMNVDACKAMDPFSLGAILDVAPFLFNFKFLLKETHKQLEETARFTTEFAKERIQQAKVNTIYLFLFIWYKTQNNCFLILFSKIYGKCNKAYNHQLNKLFQAYTIE